MRICVGVLAKARKRVSDPLAVELQVVVGCLIWELSTKPRSSATEIFTHFLKFKFSFMYILDVFHACMSLHHVHAVPEEAREDVRSPETGAINSYEPSRSCWKSSVCHL